MSFTIKTQEDVFKFALPLYDYLSTNGHAEEARALDDLVDACFPNDTRALEAHRKAFNQIQESVHDLPIQYRLALESAIEVLAEQ